VKHSFVRPGLRVRLNQLMFDEYGKNPLNAPHVAEFRDSVGVIESPVHEGHPELEWDVRWEVPGNSRGLRYGYDPKHLDAVDPKEHAAIRWVETTDNSGTVLAQRLLGPEEDQDTEVKVLYVDATETWKEDDDVTKPFSYGYKDPDTGFTYSALLVGPLQYEKILRGEIPLPNGWKLSPHTWENLDPHSHFP